MEIVNFCATHKLDAGKLWSLFNDGGAWRSYMMEGGLSADEISDGRALLYAAARGEIGKPAAPTAPISGTDPSRTAPAAALDPTPTSPKPESTDAFWRRIVGAAPETPASGSESAKEAVPAPTRANAPADAGDRLRAILTAPEAKGRRRLAEHIAMNTKLGVDEARAALAASPIEAKPAPAHKPAAPAARSTEALVPMQPETSADWARRQLDTKADAEALWRKAIAASTPKPGRLG